MLPKIALGNVRKSLRDFSVFFITLVFGACVFYAFASINEQTAVIDLNELQSEAVATVTRMLSGVSSCTPTGSSCGGASESLASTSRWAWAAPRWRPSWSWRRLPWA